jgi:hypothetical protein
MRRGVNRIPPVFEHSQTPPLLRRGNNSQVSAKLNKIASITYELPDIIYKIIAIIPIIIYK